MAGRWKALDRSLANGSPLDLGTGAYAELAVRVHEAIAARDTTGLREFVAQMEEAVCAGHAQAPSTAVAAITGSKDAPQAERAAYAMGQLGFAYRVLATAAHRRADKDFEERLGSDALAPYVAALSSRDMTGSELARAVGKRVETVSRNLRELRAMGAVECRRQGTSFVNFLTPAARALAGLSGMDAGREPRSIAVPVQLWARGQTQAQAPIMRGRPSFALPADAASDLEAAA